MAHSKLRLPGVLAASLLCMGVVVLPATGTRAAQFAGGTGEPAAPYQIATAEQLISIGDDPNLLDKYFTLVADIDLDPNLPGGKVFTRAVIAHEESMYRSARVAFTGRFYGNGHAIRHLTIDSTDIQYFGLFGNIGSTGRVYDLVLEDICITIVKRAGGLAGFNQGGIVNCSVTGRIRGPERSSWLGGLVGTNTGSITNCRAAVTVTGGDYSMMLGALVGLHRGGLSGCSATGDVSGGYGSLYLGGLAGASVGGVLRNSFASVHILGGDASWGLGGLVGRADFDSTILNCHADGPVTAGAGGHDLGGLIGSCYKVDVAHSSAMGPVTGGDRSYALGGLLGSSLGVRVSDCYAVGEVNGFRALGGFVGRVQTDTFIANCHAVGRVLRYDSPWGRGGFAGSVESFSDVHIAGCFWDVEATGAAVSAAGVGLMTAQMQDISIFQAAGWDVAGDRSDGTADQWLVPLGGLYPVLATQSGSYEPHMLQGSGASFDPYLIATAEDLGAIGRYSRSAWYRLVADIDLSGITWTTAPIGAFRGVFDGRGRRITNLTIQADQAVDLGLFGRIEADAWVFNLGLENVSIVVSDGSHRVGGLAGENAGNIVNCYVTGAISAGVGCRSVGGVVGVNRFGVVADSYSTVAIAIANASTQVGGLTGYNYMGVLAHCYAAGGVFGPGEYESIGGLVGGGSQNARTYSCYYLTSSDGGGPNRGAGIAVTAEQLMQSDTFVDWDFQRTWMLCQGQDFPRLLWQGLSCD